MTTTTPKSVVITGCSAGGIGFALVSEFARRGLRVYATSRNTKKMEPLKDLKGVTLLQLDVTNQKSISSAARQASAEFTARCFAGAAARPRRASLAVNSYRLPRSSCDATPLITAPTLTTQPQILAHEPNGPDILINNAGVGIRGALLVSPTSRLHHQPAKTRSMLQANEAAAGVLSAPTKKSPASDH